MDQTPLERWATTPITSLATAPSGWCFKRWSWRRARWWRSRRFYRTSASRTVSCRSCACLWRRSTPTLSASSTASTPTGTRCGAAWYATVWCRTVLLCSALLCLLCCTVWYSAFVVWWNAMLLRGEVNICTCTKLFRMTRHVGRMLLSFSCSMLLRTRTCMLVEANFNYDAVCLYVCLSGCLRDSCGLFLSASYGCWHANSWIRKEHRVICVRIISEEGENEMTAARVRTVVAFS